MIGNKTLLKSQGFTLVEMLVTVGIFAIAVMISSAVFMNVNKLQQNTANLEKLQNEGRYVLEKIGKEARGRELDYSQLSFDLGGVTDSLVFKEDEFGEVLSIVFDPISQSIKMKSLSDGIEDKVDLSSSDVIVESAKFIVNPQVDPYDAFASSTIQSHPRVTLFMRIRNRNTTSEYQKQLDLQTTISSKVYR